MYGVDCLEKMVLVIRKDKTSDICKIIISDTIIIFSVNSKNI